MTSVNYNTVWGRMRLRNPQSWPTWPIIVPYLKTAKKRLEIGAGTFPKFLVQGTFFLDTSAKAIEKLEQEGGRGIVSDAGQNLPFLNDSFDLIGAFEVFEHLKQPEKTFQEVLRILKPAGTLLFSVPIHKKYWSRWDAFAGHVQRFEPAKLSQLLSKQGFSVECCYIFRRALPIPFLKYVHWLGCVIVPRLPKIHYYLNILNIFFYSFTWMLKAIIRPRYYSSLDKIPQDSLSLFVVCRKGPS